MEVEFVGPNVEAIEKMGDKIFSKELAKSAGLPVLEPIKVNELSKEDIQAAVYEMNFPC